MKRIVGFLFAIIFVLGFSVPLGSAQTHYIDDLGIAVVVPDGMYILTRNMQADDPFLKMKEETPESVRADLIKNDTFIQLWADDFSFIIDINMTVADNTKDLKNYNESEYDACINSIRDEYEDECSVVSDLAVCRMLGNTYIQFSVYMNVTSLEFYNTYFVTIDNGKKIVIDLFTLDQPATPEQKEFFEMFVDYICFGTREEIMGDTSSQASSQKSASSQKASSKTSSVASKAAVSSVESKVTLSKTVSSVSSKPVAVQPNQPNSENSVWAVLITLLIFATPIIIHRYVISKKPIESKKALIITIFYGLGAAAVTALLAVFFDVGFVCVGAVILWSFINYLILTTGKKETATMMQVNEQRQDLYYQDTIKPEQKPLEEEPETTENSIEPMKEQNNSMVAPHPNFCENCGEKLRPESKFCPKCGEKVEELGD